MATIYNVAPTDYGLYNTFADNLTIDTAPDSVIRADDTTSVSQFSNLFTGNTDFALYTEIPKWHFLNPSSDWKYTVVNSTDATTGRVTGLVVRDAHDPSGTVNLGALTTDIINTDTAKFSTKQVQGTTRFASYRQCSNFLQNSFKVGSTISVPVLDQSGNPLISSVTGQAVTRQAQLFGVYMNNVTGESLPYWAQDVSGNSDAISYYYADNAFLNSALSTIADGSGVRVFLTNGSAVDITSVVPPNPDFAKSTPDSLVTSTQLTDTTFLSNMASAVTYEYPPGPMTANTTTISVNNVMVDGVYVANRSGAFSASREAFNAFDKNMGTSYWENATSSQYTAPSNAVYTGANVTYATGAVAYTGEWIQLLCPRAFCPRSYSIRPVALSRVNLGPAVFSLLASNTGASGSWTVLDTRSAQTWASSGPTVFTLPSVTGNTYTYFRLVFTTMYGDSRAMLAELSFTDVFNVQFPSASLTGASTALTEGTYTVSSSTTLDATFTPAWFAFDGNASTQYISNAVYNWTGAAYVTTGSGITVNSTSLFYSIVRNGLSGEHLTIFMPNPTMVTSYSIQTNGIFSAPMDFQLLGSYNQAEWYTLDTETGITNWSLSGNATTFTFPAPTAYNATTNPSGAIHNGLPFPWYRLAVTKVTNNQSVQIVQLRLFGKNVQFPGLRFPPAPLTATTMTLSGNYCTSGTYVSNSSFSLYNWGAGSFPAYLFDYDYNTYANPSIYHGSIYQGSAVTWDASTSIAYSGEWVQLQSPTAFTLSGYQITAPSVRFTILGSNDGNNFRFIQTIDNPIYSDNSLLWTNGPSATFTIASPSGAYSYYRMVAQKSFSGQPSATCSEWTLYDTSGNKYPPFAMTSNTASGYTASTSSTLYGAPYLCFDTASGPSWQSQATYKSYMYNGSSTTVAGGVTYSGEWAQLQVPAPVQATSYSLMNTNTGGGNVSECVLLGSNDGSTWALVDAKNLFDQGSTYVYHTNLYTNSSVGEELLLPVTGTNSNTYTYFRLVITRCNGWHRLTFPGWCIFGRTLGSRTIPSAALMWSPTVVYNSQNTNYQAVMKHMSSDPSRALLLYYNVDPRSDLRYQGDELYASWSSVAVGSASGITPVKYIDPSSASYASQLALAMNKFTLARALPASTVRSIRQALQSQALATSAPRLAFPTSYYQVQQRINSTDTNVATRNVLFNYEVANLATFSGDYQRTALGGRLLQMLTHYLYGSSRDTEMGSLTNFTVDANRITDAFLDALAARLRGTDAASVARRNNLLNQLVSRYGRNAFSEWITLQSSNQSGTVRHVARSVDDILLLVGITLDSRVSNRSLSNADTIRLNQIPLLIRLTSSIFADGTAPFLEFDAGYVVTTNDANPNIGLVSTWPNLAFRRDYLSYSTNLSQATASGLSSSGPVALTVTSASGDILPAVSFNRSVSGFFTLPSIAFAGSTSLASSGFTFVGVATFDASAGTGTDHLFHFSASGTAASNDDPMLGFARNGVSGLSVISRYGSYGYNSGSTIAAASGSIVNRKIYAATFTPSGVTNTTARIFIDTAASGPVTTISGLAAMTSSWNSNFNYIGYSPDTGNAGFQGLIHHLQFYPRALSTSELTQLFSYLRYKWRL